MCPSKYHETKILYFTMNKYVMDFHHSSEMEIHHSRWVMDIHHTYLNMVKYMFYAKWWKSIILPSVGSDGYPSKIASDGYPCTL